MIIIRYLPEMSQTDDESPQEFAKRVQTAMAESLNIEPTMFTSGDKMEYVKRHCFSPQPPTGNNSSMVVWLAVNKRAERSGLGCHWKATFKLCSEVVIVKGVFFQFLVGYQSLLIYLTSYETSCTSYTHNDICQV